MNRFGFLKVAAAVPHVRIADCDYNAQHITELIRKGADRGASIILFPELCITSYTCGDLIQQPALLHAAEQALGYILAQTRELPIVAIVGMPVTYGNALYNCAVVFAQGRIHGVSSLGADAAALFALEGRCTDLYVLARPDLAQSAPGQDYRTTPVMI